LIVNKKLKLAYTDENQPLEIQTLNYDDPFIDGMDPKNKKYVGQVKDGKAYGIGRC
jgi:hypothetical protein